MLDWKPLVSEDNKGLSLGRVAFWIALCFSYYFWFLSAAPFPPALLEFLGSTLLYNLGAKGVNAYSNKWSIMGNQQGQQVPIIQPQQNLVTQQQTSKPLPQDIDDTDLKQKPMLNG